MMATARLDRLGQPQLRPTWHLIAKLLGVYNNRSRFTLPAVW